MMSSKKMKPKKHTTKENVSNKKKATKSTARVDKNKLLIEKLTTENKELEDQLNQNGYLSVGTPANLLAWTHLVEKYGNFNLSEVIQPSINIARNGFRVTNYLSDIIKDNIKELANYKESANIYLPNGKAPQAGDIIKNPNYALTLPINGLISKKYAQERANEININKAQSYKFTHNFLDNDSNNTTHFNVADSEGNIVSMTQTINNAFGSKVAVEGTGMMLNNCMLLFDPHPGNANSIQPYKRSLSSMTPTIILKT